MERSDFRINSVDDRGWYILRLHYDVYLQKNGDFEAMVFDAFWDSKKNAEEFLKEWLDNE